MTDRKKPGVAFWTILAVVVVLIYPLSLGPVCWLSDHRLLPKWAALPCHYFYRPLQLTCGQFEPTHNALNWYVSLWVE